MARKREKPITGTTPRPFVFVLMPFSQEFDDIYHFGIKGAAEDAGAYAERIDEQIFTEGILDRIFNQINKADVVVADMTGRNANVFYEVGYAHALGKLVLLLTKNVEDIPFDLKHRSHLVYGGKISDLRSSLVKRIKWAIVESRRSAMELPQLAVYVEGQRLPNPAEKKDLPVIDWGHWDDFERSVDLDIHNESVLAFSGATHLYLLSTEPALANPGSLQAKTFRRSTAYISGQPVGQRR